MSTEHLTPLVNGGDRHATVTVVGLGYIGLPTSAVLATHGHMVYGHDVNQRVIEHLERGDVHIEEPGLLAFVRDALRAGRFVPTRSVQAADVYMICVPTPLDHDVHVADMRYVQSAAESLVPLLKKGDMVILESTVPVGTTKDFLAPILAASGLDVMQDLDIVHCPETVLPGNMIHELTDNARVIGGLTPRATERAKALYETFVRGPLVTTDASTAEFIKLVQNSYRDVNIALANELALIARDVDVDVREAIGIANQHPRVHLHQPGPGVGGHCIPIDPWFLIQNSKQARLLRMAREVNDQMPGHVVERVRACVDGLESPRIALLGLAYKPDVDDVRESPSFMVSRGLTESIPHAEIRLHDPHVTEGQYDTVALANALRGADCVVVLTGHRRYGSLDPELTRALVAQPTVLDTTGVLDPAAWRAAGFRMETL